MLSQSKAEPRSAAGLPVTSSRFGRLLIEGEARLRSLRVGGCVMAASSQSHRVEWTDAHVPTVWLAVHYGPVLPQPP